MKFYLSAALFLMIFTLQAKAYPGEGVDKTLPAALLEPYFGFTLKNKVSLVAGKSTEFSIENVITKPKEGQPMVIEKRAWCNFSIQNNGKKKIELPVETAFEVQEISSKQSAEKLLTYSLTLQAVNNSILRDENKSLILSVNCTSLYAPISVAALETLLKGSLDVVDMLEIPEPIQP